jgi:hypothetical protein
MDVKSKNNQTITKRSIDIQGVRIKTVEEE